MKKSKEHKIDYSMIAKQKKLDLFNEVYNNIYYNELEHASYDITFSIQKHVNYGESIQIVGNYKEFGNWDVSKAVPLNWTVNDNWICKIRIYLCPYDLEFKFIIKSYDNSIIWQKDQNLVISKELLAKNSNFNFTHVAKLLDNW